MGTFGRRGRLAEHLSSALFVSAALMAVTACSGPNDPSGAEPTPSVTTQEPRSDEDLAKAVVRVVKADAAGKECNWGSGTIVDPNGTIITNFHVVEASTYSNCDYEQLIISMTTSSDNPPTPTYVGKVHAVDVAADLAVIRIASSLDSGPVTASLPVIPLGDSADVEFGETIRVLGYPTIGGGTITSTAGTVSGFLTSPEFPGQRAWIKTATTISGGNSGGATVDESGHLIGVPTRAGAGDTSRIVDCRLLEDTNRDGVIDSNDTCVPTGGFINGMRPVNLALPLLEEASTAPAIDTEDLVRVPGPDLPSAEPGGDPVIANIVFGPDVSSDDQPTEETVALPSQTSSVCGFFDYQNMVDGASVDLVWSHDGDVVDGVSDRGGTWTGGQSGSWWICARAGSTWLADGLWELAVFVDDEDAVNSEAIYVGDEYPIVTLDVANGLDEDVCYLNVSPTGSDRWGQDELGSSEMLKPGQEVRVQVGASTYDVQALDCDGTALVRMDDVEVLESTALTLTTK